MPSILLASLYVHLAITLLYLICFAFYVTHDISMDTVINIASHLIYDTEYMILTTDTDTSSDTWTYNIY